MTGPGVVPPSDPTLATVVVVISHFEIVGTSSSVCELTESSKKLNAVPVTVVGSVEELPAASFVALRHGVGYDSVVPRAPVDLNAHADGTFVVAVGQETDLAGPQRRFEVSLRFQVRVRVSVDYLDTEAPGISSLKRHRDRLREEPVSPFCPSPLPRLNNIYFPHPRNTRRRHVNI